MAKWVVESRALLLSSCVSIGSSTNLSVPQLPHPRTGDTGSKAVGGQLVAAVHLVGLMASTR